MKVGDVPRIGGHTDFWQRPMPRRQFISKGAAGAFGLALGSGMLGAGLLKPQPVQAAGPGTEPRPIPGGFQLFGPGSEVFHAYDTQCGFEPSTITDFMGNIGEARIQGNGTRTDTKTGHTKRLFYDADMRFMQGNYIGVDGRLHQGTFCLLWLDLFEGQGGSNVASISPGNVPGGLLWTIPMPSTSVNLNPPTSNCSLTVKNVVTKDFGTVQNAFLHGRSVPVTISFEVKWLSRQRTIQVQDKFQGFRGEFNETVASITCSAREAGFTFVTDPPNPLGTVFAEYGLEHNGVFFSKPFPS